jgi:hypothetical protein
VAISKDKILPGNPIAKKMIRTSLNPASSVTGVVQSVTQVPYGFVIEALDMFCTAVTGAIAVLVGTVAPGTATAAITLAIGTTVTKFQTTAFLAVLPYRAGPVIVPQGQTLILPPILNQAATDNIAFSLFGLSAFTINTALGAALVWGAIRVQVDKNGVFSTKVRTADQSYATEAIAKVAAPAADVDKFDMGTITIQVKASQTFIAGTTALNSANLNAVNYNGKASGFVNAFTANPSFVAGSLVLGTPVTALPTRGVSLPGGLLLVAVTTGAGVALTNGVADVMVRPWPLNGEVAPAGVNS